MTGKGMLSMQGQQLPVSVELKEIRGKALREDIDMGGMQLRQVVGQRQGATCSRATSAWTCRPT